MECFTSMVDCPSFKPWEVAEFCPERMYIEIAGLTEADIANELLHKAAFREGLGNSLYSHQHMVSSSMKIEDAIQSIFIYVIFVHVSSIAAR